MNNYIPCYPEIISNIVKFDIADPGVWFLSVKMLEDLRDEIADLRADAERFDSAYGVGALDICIKKINRRIDFLYQKKNDIINS